MKRAALATSVLLVALAFPSCARFSASSRNERAYAKYVKKSRAAREERRTKILKTQQEIPPAPEQRDASTTTDEPSPEG